MTKLTQMLFNVEYGRYVQHPGKYNNMVSYFRNIFVIHFGRHPVLPNTQKTVNVGPTFELFSHRLLRPGEWCCPLVIAVAPGDYCPWCMRCPLVPAASCWWLRLPWWLLLPHGDCCSPCWPLPPGDYCCPWWLLLPPWWLLLPLVNTVAPWWLLLPLVTTVAPLVTPAAPGEYCCPLVTTASSWWLLLPLVTVFAVFDVITHVSYTVRPPEAVLYGINWYKNVSFLLSETSSNMTLAIVKWPYRVTWPL